ncbi:hypothetical protein [Serinicoccus marinus]|uniref:hypothetical protein n=1 Tax=Serinicoccus marinus TaxID=247333 RepID=UPI001444ED93|nr:hypothetical protein [Serinicoccus marinus]
MRRRPAGRAAGSCGAAAHARRAGGEIDAVCPRHDGRAQWLLAVYRRAALDAARARRAGVAETGASVRSLVAPLRWRELEFDGVHLGDVDTPADLERWSSALDG